MSRARCCCPRLERRVGALAAVECAGSQLLAECFEASHPFPAIQRDRTSLPSHFQLPAALTPPPSAAAAPVQLLRDLVPFRLTPSLRECVLILVKRRSNIPTKSLTRSTQRDIPMDERMRDSLLEVRLPRLQRWKALSVQSLGSLVQRGLQDRWCDHPTRLESCSSRTRANRENWRAGREDRRPSQPPPPSRQPIVHCISCPPLLRCIRAPLLCEVLRLFLVPATLQSASSNVLVHRWRPFSTACKHATAKPTH